MQSKLKHRRPCEVGTCTLKHYARGVCRRHYSRGYNRTAIRNITLQAAIEAVKAEERNGGSR